MNEGKLTKRKTLNIKRQNVCPNHGYVYAKRKITKKRRDAKEIKEFPNCTKRFYFTNPN